MDGLLLNLPLIVQFLRALPTLQGPDDPDLWAAKMHDSMHRFRQQVEKHYTQGTLLRLLDSDDSECRRGAVLALGLCGSMEANAPIAARLHDVDPAVAQSAADALWQLWFRGGNEEDNAELIRAIHLPDFLEILAALDEIIRSNPQFAEAYNQRAILFFRRGEYNRSVADCEKVLSLNPHHFGAQAGLGQCLMKLRKPRAAAQAFRLALEINPLLTHLEETIEQLEQSEE